MSDIPVPTDAWGGFTTYFENSVPPNGPATLPVPSPTKSFWSYPGLSSDWPIDPSDPEGHNYANPYARQGSEDALPTQTDLVIIGSGITGVSIAMELGKLVRSQNQRQIKVVMLEARDFCSGATARNGGHLAAHVASGYSHFSKLYDQKEVKRCFEIEQHTVSTLVSIIKDNGWTKDVDLVEGGRNYLVFTEQELLGLKEDWTKCLEACIITEDAGQWFTAEEMEKEFGVSYPMLRVPGYNLWPLRLVTKLFELAKNGSVEHSITATSATPGGSDSTPREKLSSSSYIGASVRGLMERLIPGTKPSTQLPATAESGDPPTSNQASTESSYKLSLYTHTPVQAVVPGASPSNPRWSVQTSRGNIDTEYVVFATNGYTSHLLPQLTGPNGIVPVRGQVSAIRAKVGYKDEGWTGTDGSRGLTRSGWLGNEGFEYWFPRPHPNNDSPLGTDKIDGSDISSRLRKPLAILGGARETLKGRGYGMYETDDSVLDAEVTTGLRQFLGTIFPDQYPGGIHATEKDGDSVTDRSGVEIEWSGIMGFTKSGDPLVGRVRDSNGTPMTGLYISAGYTGHGMPRAYSCAEVLAGLVWSDLTTPKTTWTPPEWFPRHYLTENF